MLSRQFYISNRLRLIGNRSTFTKVKLGNARRPLLHKYGFKGVYTLLLRSKPIVCRTLQYMYFVSSTFPLQLKRLLEGK